PVLSVKRCIRAPSFIYQLPLPVKHPDKGTGITFEPCGKPGIVIAITIRTESIWNTQVVAVEGIYGNRFRKAAARAGIHHFEHVYIRGYTRQFRFIAYQLAGSIIPTVSIWCCAADNRYPTDCATVGITGDVLYIHGRRIE